MLPRIPAGSNSFPPLKPALQPRASGGYRPPLGTLRQELERATQPRRRPADAVLPDVVKDRFLLTIAMDPDFAERLVKLLGRPR